MRETGGMKALNFLGKNFEIHHLRVMHIGHIGQKILSTYFCMARGIQEQLRKIKLAKKLQEKA